MQDKSLGEVVRGIPALVHLMDYIEKRAACIYIRDCVNGELRNYPLSDLPAPLAIHWSFEFLRNCTIPVPVCPEADSSLLVYDVSDDPTNHQDLPVEEQEEDDV